MTLKTTQLRDAITFALVVGATAAAGTGVAVAQEGEQQATTLDRIEVTGSRIKRTDIETSQPVFSLEPRRHPGPGPDLGRRRDPEHHRQRLDAQHHLQQRRQRRNPRQPAQPRLQPHPGAGQRPSLGRWHRPRRRSRPQHHPDRCGRAHRSPEGRRLGDLRLRRDRRRGQRHPAPELSTAPKPMPTSASSTRATAPARPTTSPSAPPTTASARCSASATSRKSRSWPATARSPRSRLRHRHRAGQLDLAGRPLRAVPGSGHHQSRYRRSARSPSAVPTALRASSPTTPARRRPSWRNFLIPDDIYNFAPDNYLLTPQERTLALRSRHAGH